MYHILLFYLIVSVIGTKTIELKSHNLIILNSAINAETASNIILNINKLSKKNDLYLYINSPGGELDSGFQIIHEVEKYNISCIADVAYSMAFAILQSCNIRYVTPYSSIMQHQMSYHLHGEHEYNVNQMGYLNNMYNFMLEKQSKRLNITVSLLKKKVNNEWWLFGQDIITNRAADELVYVKCSESLITGVYNVTRGNKQYMYSKCPLIRKELHKEKTKKSDDMDFIYFI